MRVSTLSFQNTALRSILNQQSTLGKLQLHEATGKRINTPSDDPTGASQVVHLKEKILQAERYTKNSDLASSRLELEDGVLSSVTDAIHHVKELTIQGSTSTLGESDRTQIKLAIEESLSQLMGLANTKDATGSYLFAGYQNRSTPFSKDAAGNVMYHGDQGQQVFEVAAGIQTAISDSGDSVFNDIPNGNGQFQIEETGAANTGSALLTNGSITDLAAYVPDDYRLTFVTNGAGDLAYQVIGANSGQIIPALPGTVPADAPAYVEGQGINFNGIDFTVTGKPDVGDDFSIKPSTRQSLFKTVENVISALDTADFTPAAQAKFQLDVNQSLSELDNALDAVLQIRNRVGSRLNTVETAKSVNQDFVLHSQEVLSSIEQVDMAKAISDLTQQATSLDAAQQSFLKIQGLSLFRLM